MNKDNYCYRIEQKISRAHEGMTLRDYLRKELHVSRRALSAIKYKGGFLLIDGRVCTVRHVLKRGEVLKVIFPPEEPSDFLKSEPVPLDIAYEDDDLVIVNKPPNMAVIPSHQYPSGTVANGLLAYFRKEKLASTVHIVNRLDRNTSGLMLVAKNRFSHEKFFRMQKKKEIHRRYLAFAAGVLSEDEGILDMPIGRKEGSIIERRVDWSLGRRSVTRFKILHRYKDRTLLVIQLETGRTHQIRVHFSSIGHPLLGDDLYGGPMNLIKRQALHSFELSFVHPFTGQSIHLHASPPADMARLTDLTLDLNRL
ncbi:RluA family pseudouridine synthase [Sporolactobacillus sp. Y61]|uniref:Pseudouridine synthase n=1 Tax=Sporolactobacillus sp. Y61 TaxID=3160863 RepID=A0AAU8IBY1_9BACL